MAVARREAERCAQRVSTRTAAVHAQDMRDCVMISLTLLEAECGWDTTDIGSRDVREGETPP
jgi:hypothetical protein